MRLRTACGTSSRTPSARRLPETVVPLSYSQDVADRITWTDEAAAHMLARHGVTGEVLADPALRRLTPYPQSRVRATALVGWSPSAQRVLLVVVYRDLAGALHGINGWPARGRWLRDYWEGARR